MYIPRDTVAEVPNFGRRGTLRTIGIAGVAGLGIGFGVMTPALAANAPDWPADAFSKKNEADALKALYGRTVESSDKISLEAPEIAENGAVVPIAAAATLPDVTSMAFLVAENPYTLAAVYRIPPGTQPSVACRLKMGKTSKVIAVVESGGKLFSASKDVKVTLGGCGG
ncbi:MAG: thiosulfate oxidation carrier protein SoxY [Rhodoferax sp.]